MSVFAAYASEADDSSQPDVDNGSWLTNSSFQATLPNVSEVQALQQETCSNSARQNKKTQDEAHSDSELKEDSPKVPVSKKRKKKHKKSDKNKKSEILEYKIIENDIFKIETKGARELLSVNTISRPSAPIYHVKFFLGNTNYKKCKSKNKIKRYYKHLSREPEVKEDIITQKNVNQIGFAPRDENFTGFKQEQELSEKTGFFNSYLTGKPEDINVWLEYINFQDTVHQFEKSYRKGSIAKAQRVLGERKLSILDKALMSNPYSEKLHRERLNIAVVTFPSDELQIYLRDLVEKDKSNIILWQGYIEATQCSMSHCSTPEVLSLYTKCLSTLHQLRQTNIMERHLLEECILKMLYQCGLFMKQAGLFEQLWTLLRMYLELNLSPNNSSRFHILSEFAESQLMELEDIIFASNLPLHELWLRTEKLREACHWLPSVDDEKCEDPQRIVLTDDVVQLIHPITMPGNIFKMSATIFSLLKIPLLPCRHSTMGELGLDYVPWSFDSVEPLLSMYFPLYPVDTSTSLWSNIRLAVGPQYLNKIPGHEEYLGFINKIMENVANCLTGDEKTAITLWYFKFQRLLIILDKVQLFTMTEQFKKRIKKNFKECLKLEENRQNAIFYLEYALTELEFGNVDSCLKIINTAVSFTQRFQMTVSNVSTSQKNWCNLYKHLVQLHIAKNTSSDENEALKLLCQMSLQQNELQLNDEIKEKATNKFNTVTRQLMEAEQVKLACVEHFLPNFFTDWIICHVWFILLCKGPNECFEFFRNILHQMANSDTHDIWQKEVLYEFYIALLFKYSRKQCKTDTVKLLESAMETAIELYPNNVFVLSVLKKQYSLEYSLGLQWWKIKKLLLKSDRALPSLFALIIVNQQLEEFQNVVQDTITGTKYEISTSLKNKMLSLFKNVTTASNTRKCGLIWRLYLQFVYTYFSPDICRKVYYCAVEECPWLKALYMDAAIYIPAELSQIQDLFIEKQLRLHVTPEELDVLRS
ncbi:unnamed protein product [Diabrotica balteata]|uniref:Protein NRDE2 homolog n=1 Tax=Diabrotica balteata TaxID=107213 RepID=A0A9N9T2A4_DIABA|nr:unnamed protein product [Diabrotica balteata]